MRKMRLLLIALLAIISVQHASALAVGDRFQGRVVNNGTPNINVLDGVTYQVTSVAAGNLTVAIYDTSKTGDIKFEGWTADSVGTIFKVESIVSEALVSCRSSATSIELSENFRRLSYSSIVGMHNLTTLKLPKSLEYVETIPIVNCPKLATVEIVPGGAFKTENNVLYSADGTILHFYPMALTAASFDIPSGVITVFGGAFKSNRFLTTISIPASCTNLRDNWCADCENLASFTVAAANPNYSEVDGTICSKDGTELVAFPQGKTGTFVGSGIKILHTGAFVNAKKLTRIELPDVETIKARPIESCIMLEEVVFGAALSTVEREVAYGSNKSFKRFSFSADNPNFRADATGDHAGVLYSKDYTRLINYPQAREDSRYTTHPSTKRIEYTAFNYAHNLQTLTITNNVEHIDRSITYYSAVSSIIFSPISKVKTIMNYAFRRTQKLTDIALPASVETIGTWAFDDCTALNYVSVAGNSNLKSIGSECFRGCTALEAFQMLSPSSHKAATLSVGDRAFQNLDKLNYVSFGRNLSSLGTSAFGNCTALETIEFFMGTVATPAKLLHIGANVFQNCGLREILLPSSVKTIGNEAFNSCQRLETVFIPDATTSIGSQAFLFCGKLKEIVVEKGNPSYASSDGILLNKARTRLMQFPAGKAESDFYTMLPPTVTEIADSAFYYNRNLRTVTIPRNVTSIGRYTFALCPNLEQVNLLGEATTADATAFHDMNQQTTLGGINLAVRDNDRYYYRNAAPWSQARNASTLTNPASNDVSFYDAEGNEYFPLLASDDGQGNKTYDAMLLNVTESQAVTWRIPETVTRNGIDYAVKLIGDEAFKGDEGVCEELILPDQVNYVGIKAFEKTVAGGTPIKRLFILNPALARENFATTRFETDETGTDYSEIPSETKVYVKKSVINSTAFTEAFKRYTEDAYTFRRALVRLGTPDMFSYKVPGISIGKKKDGVTPLVYGTFCREFDVDLSDYFESNGTGKVDAFIAGDGKIKPGAGQGGTDGTEYHVIMHSINENATDGTDGTYIPAYTGVLLRAVGGETPTAAAGAPEDFYYTIGEKDINAPVTGETVRMRGVYERDLVLTSTPGTWYVMQQGEFRKLPTTAATPIRIPAHRAYLELPAQAAGAKAMLFFNDGPVPTEIDAFGLDDVLKPEDASPVYDLQGRRVASPSKGIYVRNGKKVVIK